MNEIEWLEFELAYFEVPVKHFGHCGTGTPPHSNCGLSYHFLILKVGQLFKGNIKAKGMRKYLIEDIKICFKYRERPCHDQRVFLQWWWLCWKRRMVSSDSEKNNEFRKSLIYPGVPLMQITKHVLFIKETDFKKTFFITINFSTWISTMGVQKVSRLNRFLSRKIWTMCEPSCFQDP